MSQDGIFEFVFCPAVTSSFFSGQANSFILTFDCLFCARMCEY